MREWISFESIRIILGDEYVRGMLESLGKDWTDYDNATGKLAAISIYFI